MVNPSWRDGYYQARVKSVSTLSDTSVQLILLPQKRWPQHTAGQHIALTVEVNGKLVTRVFTIASGQKSRQNEGTIRLVMRVKKDGVLTPYLSALSSKSATQAVSKVSVNISAPMGHFIIPNAVMPNAARLDKPESTSLKGAMPEQIKPVVMIAGGSGITPFIAMLEDLNSASSDNLQSLPIHLLYFAKENEHLLTDELAEHKRLNTYFTYELLCRQKDGGVEQLLDNHTDSHWMVCGPQSLYDEVANTHANLPPSNDVSLDSEHFAAFPVATAQTSAEKAIFSLNHNGSSLLVDNQQTLLTQLQQAKRPVTYGCGMGICHQCQCVKKRGVVRDTRTGALSDNAEQLIQLCVSQAVTDLELQA
ncbi:2Fe-2S iron-sulfur cluster binding domain-containing protein [Alteromonas genovensis]|uniref:2Fe-2S iron-sulfur cluster binding domain-containing protein n=1 Tax=Alteromonas genovensis TaxID=471225 RepID=A0A6N9TBW9_9ALTE|nr:FAD-binding oxidoreductase [Alteromonas genovensis]NDW14784.1 2Fe-2S iron-sulfur cluster binding domain-containing protein [Alteromonas genovensis]